MNTIKSTGTILGYATGLTAGAYMVKTTAQTLERFFGYVKKPVETIYETEKRRRALRPLPVLPAGMRADDKFLVFLHNYGHSMASVPALCAKTATSARIYIGAVVLFSASILLIPIDGKNVIVDFARLSVPVAVGILAAQHAYANWLFRNCRHGSFKDFLRSGDWWPSK